MKLIKQEFLIISSALECQCSLPDLSKSQTPNNGINAVKIILYY